MPWKTSEAVEERARFVRARLAGTSSMTALCQQFGISRDCGYKWWRRFCADGRRGLEERGRDSHVALRCTQRWRSRVLRLRQAYPSWGAPKLRVLLQRRYPLGPWPAVSTLGRWLTSAGVTRRRPKRARAGPVIAPLVRTPALQPNDEWTVDFKGAFYTTDRQKVCPLTVRDLATRFVLAVRQVRPTEAQVAEVMRRLFRRYGRPKAIRTDNGPPFGSSGPRGWTPLTAHWVRLGIAVYFGRPACPQDNAGHEQMHGVLKCRTAKPPSSNVSAQQRRFDRWRHAYNHVRPHAGVGQLPPIALYLAAPLPLHAASPSFHCPAQCRLVPLDARGRLRWHQRVRHIGRAFAGEHVGLEDHPDGFTFVYFGPHLLGTLHPNDLAGLRPVRWRALPAGKGRELRPLP